jgi:Putative sensor
MSNPTRRAPPASRRGSPAPAGGPASTTRLRACRNPLRLATSGGLWAGAWFLLAYLLAAWLLFSAVLTAVTTATALAVTLAGLPLLVASTWVIRGCANAERARLRTVFTEPVRGRYRAAAGRGIVAQLRTRWTDPATWRDIAYLLGMFAPLMIMDTAVLTVWLVLLAGITLPAWYWAPEQTYPGGSHHGVQLGYFPSGPHGPGAAGLYVDTLPKAFAAAAAFAVAWLLFNYVLVAVARAHAVVARALLRPPPDPLAEARQMLSRPGPLPPLLATPRSQPSGPPGPAPP